MDLALRPMSTSQVLDRSFSLYKGNFLLFAGIAALPAALNLGQDVLAFFVPGEKISVLGSLKTLKTLLAFVGEAVATGATVHAVSRLHLGNPVTIAQSYNAVKRLVMKIIGITLAITLMAGGAVVLGYLTIVALAVFAGGGAVVLGFPGLIVCAIWATRIYCRYALSVPACVVEGTTVGDSLRRSKFLSGHYILRIFLVVVLTAILAVTLNAALSIPNYIAGEVHEGSQPLVLQIWEMMATFLAGTLASPIGTIAISLVYYDNRVRKEAFDLQLMMEAMGQPAHATSAVSTAIG